MGWPYEFVGLSPEEKHARRQALDQYALVAHYSALAPLLIFGGIHLARLAYRRATGPLSGVDGHGNYAEVPSSPIAKAHQSTATSRLPIQWSQLKWWMGDEIRLAGTSWGHRDEWILGLTWTAWLLLLCILGTGKDYFHLTKRFGIVAVSQLPIQYLMSLKGMNPFAWAFASSHEQVNRYHRVLGRIIYFLLIMHFILYNVYFILAGKWLKRFFAPVVFCGVVASLLFHAIALTAMRNLREAAYRLFFITHLVGAFFAPVLLIFHAKSTRWYVIECIVIFLFDLLLRKRRTTLSLATIDAIPGTTLIRVSAPLPPGQLEAFRAFPGSHVYVSLPRAGRKESTSASQFRLLEFSFNPFSVASVGEDDDAIGFVLRARRGALSRALAEHAAAAAAPTGGCAPPSRNPVAKVSLSIEGPYGLMRSKYRELLASGASRVLFVAGGVGATFIVPLYQAVSAEMPLARLQMIWAVRAAGDATWVVPASSSATGGKSVLSDERIQLFLTGDIMGLSAETRSGSEGTGSRTGTNSEGGGGSAVEMLPLPSRDRVRSYERGPRTTRTPEQNRRRPNFEKIVDDAFRFTPQQGTVAVVVCGPKEMADEVRRCVRPWAMKGRRVWYHNESFGW